MNFPASFPAEKFWCLVMNVVSVWNRLPAPVNYSTFGSFEMSVEFVDLSRVFTVQLIYYVSGTWTN